jgi:hypothetical protein
VDEAAAWLALHLNAEEVRRLARMSQDDLSSLHYELGVFIRNSFGMWGDNRDLLESCGSPAMHPDSASAILIESVWTFFHHRE